MLWANRPSEIRDVVFSFDCLVALLNPLELCFRLKVAYYSFDGV